MKGLSQIDLEEIDCLPKKAEENENVGGEKWKSHYLQNNNIFPFFKF